MRRLANIRGEEKRDTWAAFAVLFALIASHSILETARDALFLASIPATRLPWVYLAIAAMSLLVTQAQARYGGALTGRRGLAVWTALAAAITFGFWIIGDAMGVAGLYALYIWSGVLTTLVLVHFWILLGDLFSVTQAKRLYGLIGSGSVIGAIVGSALAGGLASVFDDPRHLLLCAASGLSLAALLPVLFRTAASGIRQPGKAPASLLESARFVASKPYAKRLVVLLLLAAATVTVADFLFKATVAAHVEPDKLGAFFGAVYLGLNVLSLVAQVFLVSWIVRRFNLSIALSVLPVLLFIGGAMMLVMAGMVAAVAIKGADGSLRYSLHRTSTELLYVPLSSAARRRVKAFIDVVGQRGGQVVASLVILGATALGLGARVLAIVLLVLAAGWVASALELHRTYLDLFRRRLNRNSAARLDEFPSLDIGSLETLIAALDSPNDLEVLAALDVLERERRVRLVPALILYHPSDEVVVRALDLFTRAGRHKVVPLCDRLIAGHASVQVRAAAVAARSVLDFDEARLRMCLTEEESAEVRATVMVNLIAAGAIVGSDARDTLAAICKTGTIETRVALLEAIGRRRATRFDAVLADLATAPEPEVRVATAVALAKIGGDASLDLLVDLLADEETRDASRSGFLDNGDAGLSALERALPDATRSRDVRWQLPRSISRFEPERAAVILLTQLPEEWDGMMRYRIIRALELIVSHNPDVALDRALLERSVEHTLGRCYRYIDRRVTLERGAAEAPARATPGHDLLATMLTDKVSNATGRLFRLLGLVYPNEQFSLIYRNATSEDKDARANGLELIENVLRPPLRGAVSALVDDLPGDQRIAAGTHYHTPLELGYEELLESMLESSSVTVQDLTAYHIGELRLVRFRDKVEELARTAVAARNDLPRVLELLSAAAATTTTTTTTEPELIHGP